MIDRAHRYRLGAQTQDRGVDRFGVVGGVGGAQDLVYLPGGKAYTRW